VRSEPGISVPTDEDRTQPTRAERGISEDRFTRFLLALCVWPAQRQIVSVDELVTEADWARALSLARIHGLTAILYAASAEGCASGPVPNPVALRRSYFVLAARATLALEELSGIAEALRVAGLPCLALKGAASMLSVYPDPALRPISDLDILIRHADLDSVVRALGPLGFRKIVKASSREDEWLSVMYLDGICITRGASLPVELHGSFLGGLGRPDAAIRDAWREAVALPGAGAAIMGLRPEYAFITAACHLHRNAARSLPYLKDVADLALLAARVAAGDTWDVVWEASARWGVRQEVRGVAAFMKAYLPISIPGCETASPSFAPADLAYALERLEGRGRLTEGLALKLQLMRRLPGTARRLRFLAGLAFPQAGFIRNKSCCEPGSAAGSAAACRGHPTEAPGAPPGRSCGFRTGASDTPLALTGGRLRGSAWRCRGRNVARKHRPSCRCARECRRVSGFPAPHCA